MSNKPSAQAFVSQQKAKAEAGEEREIDDLKIAFLLGGEGYSLQEAQAGMVDNGYDARADETTSILWVVNVGFQWPKTHS